MMMMMMMMTMMMMMMMMIVNRSVRMMPDTMFSDLQAFHNILGALCKSQKNQESAQVR